MTWLAVRQRVLLWVGQVRAGQGRSSTIMTTTLRMDPVGLFRSVLRGIICITNTTTQEGPRPLPPHPRPQARRQRPHWQTRALW